jgi:hypothetical protein
MNNTALDDNDLDGSEPINDDDADVDEDEDDLDDDEDDDYEDDEIAGLHLITGSVRGTHRRLIRTTD